MKWSGHKIKMGKPVEPHMECDCDFPPFYQNVEVILAVVLLRRQKAR